MVKAPPSRCPCGGLVQANTCSKCGPRPTRKRVKRDHHKLYNNVRWQRASKLHRVNHPVCVMCEKQGRVKPAALVDHITPHKGNIELFWDETNWQSLCWKCHGYKSQRE